MSAWVCTEVPARVAHKGVVSLGPVGGVAGTRAATSDVHFQHLVVGH